MNAIVALVLSFAVSASGAAEEDGDTTWSIDDGASSSPEIIAMRERIARDRVRMRNLEDEETSVLDTLDGIARDLAKKVRAARELGGRARALERRMVDLDAKLSDAEADLASLRDDASKRLGAMHRLRRTDATHFIDAPKRSSERYRMRERFEFVLAWDAALLRNLESATRIDRELRAELENGRNDLISTLEELENAREAALASRAEHAALLDALRKERSTSARLLAELARAAKRLENEFGAVHGLTPAPEAVAGGFARQRGRLPWPTAGQIEVAFGKTVDPSSGIVLDSRGIDLRAPLMAPVRAVFSGRVAFAEWFTGYGRVVIIEHDTGWHSLYAHLDAFRVERGREVAQHEVVGFVGDTGSTRGVILHFELRRGRDAVDPLDWLAK